MSDALLIITLLLVLLGAGSIALWLALRVRRRRQAALGKLTPILFETIHDDATSTQLRGSTKLGWAPQEVTSPPMGSVLPNATVRIRC